jgi:hypothetical protein
MGQRTSPASAKFGWPITWYRARSRLTRRLAGYVFLVCAAVGVLWIFLRWAESIWQYSDDTKKLLHFSFGVLVIVIIASVRWSAKVRTWMGPDTWRRQLDVRIEGLTAYASSLSDIWAEPEAIAAISRMTVTEAPAASEAAGQTPTLPATPVSPSVTVALPSVGETKGHRPDVLAIASVDVFVEKALHHLTLRAKSLLSGGIAATLGTMAILVSAIDYLYVYLHGEDLSKITTALQFGILALRAAAGAGFVGYLAYFLASLAFSCFDEAMTMYSQRHAIRFGRMCVHLRYLRGDRAIKSTELMEMFQWNQKHSSAFRRTRFAEPPKSAITMANELLEQAVKLVATVKGLRETEPNNQEQRTGNNSGTALPGAGNGRMTSQSVV